MRWYENRMGIDEIIDRLAKEWPVISGAPFSFIIAIAIVGTVIWLALRWQYGARLTHRDDEIAAYKRKLDGASPDEARLHIDRLEARIRQLEAIAPRTLGPEQIEAIIEAGRRAPGRIYITYDSAASDGGALQAQLLQAFRKAGWAASGNFMAGGEDDYVHEFVLNLPADATPASLAARTALESAKISFASGQRSDNNPDVDAEIVIFARIT
ncbi:hypothetical protein [Mesorhizobium sp.]|uniref:hypothetical protein n=1 Tax=Mesorhizobium sp. TaxID=1871066 RepID=UPI000FE2C410|nr:hypothetical protein [Mesorhizobium sp.]RWH69157.1 MAG: hypothetical protein EOQ84_23775 [Mesorhizobium sp.]RWL24469.1 MAG: hypothetical protein EOR63_30165 [Mesorhizobium sp.]RWL26930.1 MAG: hypothetical protein EOR58_16940 [Mesorhizobium sp.]RWL38055.1 MAG: hypothetical protein EOR59_15625 [Mesorhizobium sp.]RWL56843.1 MAG: hypothetical protein EOR62_05500 [Mesorhizobium sp.]